jgi:hypothetical protein
MPSHDQNFKNLIGDYLLQALRFIVPEVTRAWPDDVSVTLIRQEQFKDRLGDTFKELDIPIYVEFPDGSREALVIVVENESRDRPEFLHYLAIVCLHISMQRKTNRVVPIAFYPFQNRPLAERLTLSDDERKYLDFNCLTCILGTMQARDYERSKNIVARLCLPLMARDPADKLLMVTRAYEGLAELEPDTSKRIKYSEFVGMYAALDIAEAQEFREKYVDESPFKEDLMSLTQIWKEEGKAEGIAEGIAQGKAQGKAEGAVNMITDMHASGTLTAAQARAQLNLLALRDDVPMSLVNASLLKIKD